MHNLTQKDIEQIQSKGLTPEMVKTQIKNFTDGFPYLDIVGPAKPEHHIKTFDKTQIRELIQKYNKKAPEKRIVKFIPASGAATRMFKNLFAFMHEAENSDNQNNILNQEQYKDVQKFFKQLKKFPFYEQLKQALETDNLDLEELHNQGKYDVILRYFLTDKGLNYGTYPKALIPFHKYKTHTRLSLEEHLIEGVYYACDNKKRVYLHFTVSPEHLEAYKETLNDLVPKYEKHFGVTFEISFSSQKESTDVIAVDMDNQPIRNEDGSLLFRPGGHGALLDNLNDIYADLVFIKNIDNVVPDQLRDTTYIYKKILGGYLLELQEQTFDFLEQLNNNPERVNLEEVRLFIEEKLGFVFNEKDYAERTRVDKIDLLFDTLNRPIRVCGMVKNQGEPGGGPFSIRDENGNISLQIVEKAQIDTKKEDQRNYMESLTHFNPVDIVCSMKNFKGEPFDLKDFINSNMGIISYKSKNGKKIKAQEHPGLWNGGMANWNTAFVEVPIITFNPVKTINDLLRKEHQPLENS